MNNSGQATLRYDLLKDLLSGKAKFSDELIQACASQGALAKYQHGNIVPVSLNTLKAHASREITPDGWKTLEEIRKQIHLKYRDAPKNLKGIKNLAKKDEISTLKEELARERGNRARLLTAYKELLQLLQKYSKNDKELQHILNARLAAFSIESLYAINQSY